MRNFSLKFSISLIIVTFLSCSSDNNISNSDDDNIIDDSKKVPSFLIIGRNSNGNTFQYDFNEESQSGELKNITEQTPFFYNSVTFRENLLSFYQLQSLWLKNINTNNVTVRENFFNNSEGETPFLHKNSGSTIFSAYIRLSVSDDLYIRAKDILSSTEVDILIGKADSVYDLLYSQNRLIIVYSFTENQETIYSVSVLNTLDYTIIKTLEFDFRPQFIAPTDSGDLLLRHGFSSTYGLYTLDNMELTNEYTSEIGLSGVGHGLYKENTAYYLEPLPVPGPYPYFPSIYNLETKTNKFINLFSVLSDYQATNSITGITFIDSVFNFENNTVLMSTRVGYGNDIYKAVIFVFDVDGNMLSNIIIDEDFSPYYLFLK
ncbi:hypothetical protein ACWGOQ_0013255 [Aquimarina sp. M1]